jgi:hypothetical protein
MRSLAQWRAKCLIGCLGIFTDPPQPVSCKDPSSPKIRIPSLGDKMPDRLPRHLFMDVTHLVPVYCQKHRASATMFRLSLALLQAQQVTMRIVAVHSIDQGVKTLLDASQVLILPSNLNPNGTHELFDRR